jgi:hypothetical protein
MRCAGGAGEREKGWAGRDAGGFALVRRAHGSCGWAPFAAALQAARCPLLVRR